VEEIPHITSLGNRRIHMGFEVTFYYHPKKEEGIGYDTETQLQISKKVGQPFEETGLEQLAAVIMSQLARRDVLIYDVEIDEFIRQKVSFKESKDGRGIVLKNKKFMLDNTAQMIAQDVVEMGAVSYDADSPTDTRLAVPAGMQPHELMYQQQQLESAYADPNKAMPIKRQAPIHAPSVNRNRILYHVTFDPYIYEKEAKGSGLRFTRDRNYPVFAVRPNPNGGQLGNLLTVGDDRNQVIEVDEKFFTPVGAGLIGDAELDFSGKRNKPAPGHKLAYEDEMSINGAVAVTTSEGSKRRSGPIIPPELQGIPVDDGSIPDSYLEVPDIRPQK
jgi:hypothetical protein